ncbi:hypothetical protein [Nocardia rhizosphaerae]|uniref:Uncharacterized protein n=1 Tax=Nocardia rhizosphaerae TaxID=1691571 RepID=A0ABV8LET5_9NOCA
MTAKLATLIATADAAPTSINMREVTEFHATMNRVGLADSEFNALAEAFFARHR